MIKELLTFVPRPVTVTSTPVPPTPSTEQERDVPTTPPHLITELPESPVYPTPTKLSRFLKHANDHLGVELATSYEFQMKRHGYGPDILHLVDDAKLVEIGIPDGDAIRLKRGAPVWYGSADAKRKRLDSGSGASHKSRSAMFQDCSDSALLNAAGNDSEESRRRAGRDVEMKVRFERRWFDKDGKCTEAKSFWGPRIEPSDGPVQADYTEYYFNEAANGLFVVPDGWVAVEGRYPEEIDSDEYAG